MRNRCKIKLNDLEIKSLGVILQDMHARSGMVSSIGDLIDREVYQLLFERMRNMYRPGKDKYTLQMNMAEVRVVLVYVLPYMINWGDALVMSLAMRMEQELDNQVNAEINIYNSMYYGN